MKLPDSIVPGKLALGLRRTKRKAIWKTTAVEKKCVLHLDLDVSHRKWNKPKDLGVYCFLERLVCINNLVRKIFQSYESDGFVTKIFS